MARKVRPITQWRCPHGLVIGCSNAYVRFMVCYCATTPQMTTPNWMERVEGNPLPIVGPFPRSIKEAQG